MTTLWPTHLSERLTRLSRAWAGPLGWLMVLALAPQVFAAESPSGPSLDEFKLISERNIFNPNRSAHRPRNEDESRNERPPHTESLALLGTLSYEKGEFAVFGGSESSFRKVLKVSDEVAGFKIAAIGSNSVELERDGRKITLQVGMQMERRGEGEWSFAGAVRLAPASNLASVSSNASKSSPTGGPAEDSDILKKLLERNAKERNNEKP